MAGMKGPEKVENMVNVLRQWQGIERDSMNTAAEVIEQSENPLVHMVMSIIRHDSLMHHRVQQFIIDSLTRADVAVSREDIAQIWDKITEHDKLEKKTIELAEQLRETAWTPVHKQLLDYLLADEKKHDALLGQLEAIKKGMGGVSGG